MLSRRRPFHHFYLGANAKATGQQTREGASDDDGLDSRRAVKRPSVVKSEGAERVVTVAMMMMVVSANPELGIEFSLHSLQSALIGNFARWKAAMPAEQKSLSL